MSQEVSSRAWKVCTIHSPREHKLSALHNQNKHERGVSITISAFGGYSALEMYITFSTRA